MTKSLIHAIAYHGHYDYNFERLKPGFRRYKHRNGSTHPVPAPPRYVKGVLFGFMEKPRKRFVGVRARYAGLDVVLDNPLPLRPRRHTDGKGFGPRPSHLTDSAALNLLRDMARRNPHQRTRLRQIEHALVDLVDAGAA